ncbi:MAG TPA: FAD-binding oxidoreductase [Vicinamibacterales bacterium]
MTRTRYGTPLWLASGTKRARSTYPRFKGSISAEVAIVGGGLTGCLVACQFARAGVEVVLLEADSVGATAALDAGFVVETPGVPFRTLHARHGLRAARKMYEASRRAALDVAAFLRRIGAKADLEPRGSLTVAGNADEEAALAREQAARASAGLDAVWLPARRVAAEAGIDLARGGLKTHSEALVDPVKACGAIVKAAVAAGAVVHDRSPVRRAKATRRGVDLTLDGGSIQASTVVIATGAPKPLVPALQRHVRVEHTYTVATPELPAALRKRIAPGLIVRTASEPPHAIAVTKRGRLIVQGGTQKAVPARLQERTLVQRTGQLMYELSLRYPAISGVIPEVAWVAPRVTGRDGLLIAGRHRNYPRHLFAVGLGSTGLAGAWLAARILLRHYKGEADAVDDLFGFNR